MTANLAPISSLVGEVADLRGVRECLQWFTREKQWINETHLQVCRVPAPTFLEQQRADLAGCLDALWRQTLAGTRRFKLYRQLKMYNDPSLNPAIYRKNRTESSR